MVMKAAAEVHTLTENGALAYTFKGVGDALVALWFKLCRGCSRADLKDLIGAVLHEAEVTGTTSGAVGAELLVMAFQTRDVRNGKGERQLFYWMLIELHKLFPEAVLELLGLIGAFGCYKDIKSLMVLADADAAADSTATDGAALLRAAALDVLSTQLRADVATSKACAEQRAAMPRKAAAAGGEEAKAEEEDGEDGPSLCAKWAPREGQARFKEQAKRLALRMFPLTAAERDGGDAAQLHGAVQRARKKYRQLVAALNRDIATVEIRMSEGEWGAIKPHALPAACLRKKQAALLNRPATKGAQLRAEKFGTPIRDASADADRVACASAMIDHLVKGGKVHGQTVNVHTLVIDAMAAREPDLVCEAQWADVRRGFEDMPACKLGRYVALSDVSGSMRGDPMAVAIGLGILISEVSHPAFRDRFMTFETTPRWHSLAGAASFHAKVQSAARAPWGGSTNFSAALELLLETCVAAQLGPEDVPEALVVISDMQFDQARGHGGWYGGGHATPEWMPEATRINAAWQAAGYAAAPTIVFWNVRGDTHSFPATADTPGVEMVSGFSQNLLKLFMEGEEEEEEEEEEQQDEEELPEAEVAAAEDGGAAVPPLAPEAPKVKVKPTPLETMRRALDADAYAPVREVCRRVFAEPGASRAVERAAEAAQRDAVVWAAIEVAAGDGAVKPPEMVLEVPAAAASALVGRGGRCIREIEVRSEPHVSISVERAAPGAVTVVVRIVVAPAAVATGEAQIGAFAASVRTAAEAVEARVREISGEHSTAHGEAAKRARA